MDILRDDEARETGICERFMKRLSVIERCMTKGRIRYDVRWSWRGYNLELYSGIGRGIENKTNKQRRRDCAHCRWPSHKESTGGLRGRIQESTGEASKTGMVQKLVGKENGRGATLGNRTLRVNPCDP